MNLKKRILFSLPAFAFMAVIFILSSLQNVHIPQLSFQLGDKLLHLTAYFVLGIALHFFFLGNFLNLSDKKIILWILIVGAIYGVTDEVHQYYVPGRQLEFLDWVADILGIAISLSLYKSLKKLTITLGRK